MKLGIVGLPNVGKSTLFNAITSTKNAEAANYPFCTIEPNSGIVAVPDKRLDKLAEIWQTNKKTPAIVEFVDIAGLVKGASQGAGLGNKFLGHIRECDAIVHVVRCFDDDNIIHVVEDVTKAEAVDPIADIEAIDYELILSDLEVVQNRAGRMAKAAKSGNNKGAAAEAAWLQQLADHLSAGKPARSFDFDPTDTEQQTVLHEMGLLSAKPVLYACNVGEDDLMEGIENNKYVPLVAARAKEEGARYIPICAKTEEDIADYSPEEKKAAYMLAVISATALIALGWIACQTIPDLILQVFGGGKGQFMIFGEKCMRIYLFGIIFAGIQIVSTNYFQATGQPLKAAILSSLRQLLLLVPLILILPLFFGLDGILYAGPIADISSAVIVILFVIFEMKKLNRWIKEYDKQQQEKEKREDAEAPAPAPVDTMQQEQLAAEK